MIKKIHLIHHTHFDIGFTDLAEEVRSSMLGRKKKTTQKDTDDDIEFIDL